MSDTSTIPVNRYIPLVPVINDAADMVAYSRAVHELCYHDRGYRKYKVQNNPDGFGLRLMVRDKYFSESHDVLQSRYEYHLKLHEDSTRLYQESLIAAQKERARIEALKEEE